MRGATLEGASQGVQFYIGNQTNWTKIGEAEVIKLSYLSIRFHLIESKISQYTFSQV